MHSSRRLRFREVANDIVDTLIGIAAEPRLLPGAYISTDDTPSADPSLYEIDTQSEINTPDMSTPTRTVRSSASTPSLRSRDGTVPPHARMDPGGNVRVVVRVRAFLPREREKNTKCLIEMNPDTQETTLFAPNSHERAETPTAGFAKAASRRANLEDRSFTFDNSFWSHQREDAHYAHQEEVYNTLGEDFLDHNFEGYHTCIFAYGQTGSGKSYTMMGTPSEPGLIPRTCEDLFQRIEAAQSETPNIAYNVRVSYFEVYNEHVRDLLVPVVSNQPPYYLKIRESPTEGPYVKDLTEAPVRSLDDILRKMQMGDRSRTVASTKMNDTSSRSHAVFTILLRQIHHDMETDETTERSSRIRLVDLAGSERAKSTEATGQRLREGSNINKSLTTLGRVIAALADPKHQNPKSKNGKRRGAGADVVPYRDSILTWLLKDSLGGNSKTAMIACIAPGDYDETLSTLRYADQAKRIRTRAVVNQDSMSTAERDAQMAAMADEIRRLQLSVSDYSQRRERDAQQHAQHEAREAQFAAREARLEEYQTHVATMQRMMEEKTLVAEGKIRNLQTENEALRLHLKLALDSLKNPIPAVVPRASMDQLEQVAADDSSLSTPKKEGGRRRSSLFPDASGADRRRSAGGRRMRMSLDPTAGRLFEERLDEEGADSTRDAAVEVAEDVSTPTKSVEVKDVSLGENNEIDEIEENKENDEMESPDEEDEEDEYDEDDEDDYGYDQEDDMEEYMQSLLSDLGMFRRKIGDDKQRFISLDGAAGGGGMDKNSRFGSIGRGSNYGLGNAGRQPLAPRANY
ncbi:kinesin family protein [Ophiostoma piceae UAMH 11346]|uniref:Kinesin-like protein n=1 Tax=Ophiostoma piceae (strain UAMH 11346) TaxID=1262450 RepID=S3BR79_OPHP1|nr:kinesin family protein [Ophiostoma piceae UAMH 11346]